MKTQKSDTDILKEELAIKYFGTKPPLELVKCLKHEETDCPECMKSLMLGIFSTQKSDEELVEGALIRSKIKSSKSE